MAQVQLKLDARDKLGESVLWDPSAKLLWWLDLAEPKLHQFDPQTDDHRVLKIDIPGKLGMIVPTDQPNTFLLAHEKGLSTLDAMTAKHSPWFDPEHGRDGIIFNDGKTDRQGRLWSGTSDAGETLPRGVMHVRDHDGSWHIADSGFPVSNGPAFSPNGTTVYISDSVGHQILAYDLAPGDVRPRRRRIFAAMLADEGFPDGLAVDSEGFLWCCHWDGWRVTRFAPDGKRDRVILLPVPRVTACAFGGPNLKTLFITTAAQDLDPAVLAAAPLSGGLFAIDAGVAGLAETPFALARLERG